MYQCSPKDPELHALRLLLLHVPGAQGFEDLCKVDHDANNESFRVAAKARGLMQSVDEADRILEEYLGATDSLSKQCELFALI